MRLRVRLPTTIAKAAGGSRKGGKYIPKRVTATRDGTTYETTVWTNPDAVQPAATHRAAAQEPLAPEAPNVTSPGDEWGRPADEFYDLARRLVSPRQSVTLLNADRRATFRWEGPLYEFLENNPEVDVDNVLLDLASDGVAFIGGGAGAGFQLMLTERVAE